MRKQAFSNVGQNHSEKSVEMSKISAIIMGKIIEPSLAAVRSFNKALQGSVRALQHEAQVAVQKGVYMAQQAYAFTNIAEPICMAPAPSPGGTSAPARRRVAQSGDE